MEYNFRKEISKLAVGSIIFMLLIGVFGWNLFRNVSALTISPPRIELSGKPGEEVKGEISLFNEQNEIKTFYSSFENFEAQGESGAPYFLGCKSGGLCSWIETDSQVTIEPGERKSIPFIIRIPKDAEPGGYFAAIFWGTTPPKSEEGGQVAIGGKLGALLLLKVEGDIKESGGILNFKTEKGKVLTSLPVIFSYRFSNDGGDRIKPEGYIIVKNIFGFTVAKINPNKGEGNVLPRSIRKFNAIWHTKKQKPDDLSKKEEIALMNQWIENPPKQSFFEAAKNQWRNFAFGVYNANLVLNYGSDNKKVEAKYTFFVIPWQILSIIVFTAILIVLIFWFGIRKYNRWLINKVTQSKKQ
jgi:hypothetical protein